MHIFLSVPFSSQVDADGQVVQDYKQHMERLLHGLRAKGHEVYCALEYAQWSFGGMSLPEDELRHDLAEIDRADRVVVLLEERVSAGVQLENGYAFARDKAIESYQIGSPAWSNIAFARLAGFEIRPVNDIADFVEQVIGRS